MAKRKGILGLVKEINSATELLTGHDIKFFAKVGWDLKGKQVAEDFMRGGVKPEPLPEDSPYTVLGIKPGCSDIILEMAWRLKSQENHPDKGGDIEIFKKVSAAHDKIVDKRKKERGEKP